MKKILKKAFTNLKRCYNTPLAIGLLSHVVLMAYSIISYLLVSFALTNNIEALPIVIFILLWAFPTDQFLTVTSHKYYKRMVKDYETETENCRD